MTFSKFFKLYLADECSYSIDDHHKSLEMRDPETSPWVKKESPDGSSSILRQHKIETDVKGKTKYFHEKLVFCVECSELC